MCTQIPGVSRRVSPAVTLSGAEEPGWDSSDALRFVKTIFLTAMLTETNIYIYFSKASPLLYSDTYTCSKNRK